MSATAEATNKAINRELWRLVRQGLTEKQADVYLFIYGTTRDKGYQPTYREMMAEFGWSALNSVHGNIASLEKKGFLLGSGDHKRRIRFLRNPDGSKFVGFTQRTRKAKGGAA